MASDTVSQAVVTAVGDVLGMALLEQDPQRPNNSRDGFPTNGY
jgi:hypothetical protein